MAVFNIKFLLISLDYRGLKQAGIDRSFAGMSGELQEKGRQKSIGFLLTVTGRVQTEGRPMSMSPDHLHKQRCYR